MSKTVCKQPGVSRGPHADGISLVVSEDLIPDLLRRGTLNGLVGRWPTGNKSIDEVEKSLKKLSNDQCLVLRMSYRYPQRDGESHTHIYAELISFTVHQSLCETNFVDILKVFCKSPEDSVIESATR